MKYKKTQIGWLSILIFAPVIFLLYMVYAYQWGNYPIPFIALILITSLFVIICAMFYKLTIEMHGSALMIIYGIGLIRIKINIDELKHVESIKTPWYYGLGIRITPEGMLYNIKGLKAVKIEYTSKGKNKVVMIGTAEPERLIQALEENFFEVA